MKDTQAFTIKLRNMMSYLLKHKHPNKEEQTLMSAIIEETGYKFVHFVITDVMKEAFESSKKSSYTAKQKTFLLQAFGKLAVTCQKDVLNHNYYLGPLVADIIRSGGKEGNSSNSLGATLRRRGTSIVNKDETSHNAEEETSLLIASLTCFPYVRPMEDERLEKVAAAVGALTVRPEYGVASQAVQSMQSFFNLDPQKYLVPTLYCYIDILSQLDSSKRTQIQLTLSNLSYLFNETRNLFGEDLAAAKWVSASEWTALRQHMEGAALIWFCSGRSELRFQVAHALANFCCKEFRELEGSGINQPFLVDALFPDGNLAHASDPSFLDHLFDTISKHHDDFSGILSWAWTRMHKSVEEVFELNENIDKLDKKARDSNPNHRPYNGPLEKHPLGQSYLHKMRFLVSALRLKKGAGETGEGTRARCDSRPHIFRPPPRLENFTVKSVDVEYFFDSVLATLHLSPVIFGFKQICRTLTYYLAKIHSSCFMDLTWNLRRPMNTHDTPPKQLSDLINKDAWMQEDFFHHEHTLAVLALLMGRADEMDETEENNILTATLDLLMQNWLDEATEGSGQLGDHACQSRTHIVDLTTHFISRKSRRKEGVDSREIIALQEQMLVLLTGRLMPDLGASNEDSCPSSPSKNHRMRTATPVKKPGVRQEIMRKMSALGEVDIAKNLNNTLVRMRARSLSKVERRPSEHALEMEISLPTHAEEPSASVKFEDNIYEGIQQLEQGILKALAELIDAIGHVQDAAFLKRTRVFLNKMSFRGAHVHEHVMLVLKMIVKYHPENLKEFIEHSFVQAHLTEVNRLLLSMNIQSGVMSKEIDNVLNSSNNWAVTTPENHPEVCAHAASACTLYAKAVLENFIDNLESWIKDDPAELARILLFCMLQQTSADMSTRCLALKLAKCLSERTKDPLHPGSKIRTRSHEAELMFTENTVQYSLALSQRSKDLNPQLIPPLLQEATFFCNIIEVKQWELLVRIITPWIANLGACLQRKQVVDRRAFFLSRQPAAAEKPKAEGSAEVETQATKMLTAIYYLTSQCYEAYQAVTSPALHGMWRKLLSEEYAAIVVPQVVKFLVAEYASAQTGSEMDIGANPSLKTLAKVLLLHLSRTRDQETRKLVIQELVKQVRHYEDKCPVAPCQFMDWQEMQEEQDERVTPTERFAFELVLNLVFENGPLFADHFPELLQNAVVMLPGTVESEAMLSYTALNLGILPKDGADNVDLDHLVSSICQSHRELAQKWSLRTMCWALNSKDSGVATASLKLFMQLEQHMQESFNFGDGQKALIQLACSLHMSIRLNQIPRLHQIIDILLMPTIEPFDNEGWISLTSVGWALLCISDVQYFKTGLCLLTHMFANEVVSQQDQKKWLLSLGEHLAFFRRDKQESLDTAIAEVALKGFTSQHTSQDTLTVMQSLAPFYTDQLPTNNKLMALLMLGNMLLRSIDILEITKVQKASRELTTSEQAEENLHYCSRAKDCLDLGGLLGMYEDREEDGEVTSKLASLADIMSELAVDLIRNVPEFAMQQVEATKDIADRHQRLDSLAQIVDNDLSHRAPTAQRSASSSTKSFRSRATVSSATPELRQMLNRFFAAFCGVFADRDSFAFTLNFFTRLLRHGPAAWNVVLLEMLSVFLKLSPYKTDEQEFAELSELLVIANHSHKKEIERLAKESAYTMAHKTTFNGNEPHMFNFLRPIATAGSQTNKTPGILMATHADNENAQKEIADCLMRIRTQTFPILMHMYNNPRLIRGLGTDARVGRVLPSRPSVDNENVAVVTVPSATTSTAAGMESSTAEASSGLSKEVEKTNEAPAAHEDGQVKECDGQQESEGVKYITAKKDVPDGSGSTSTPGRTEREQSASDTPNAPQDTHHIHYDNLNESESVILDTSYSQAEGSIVGLGSPKFSSPKFLGRPYGGTLGTMGTLGALGTLGSCGIPETEEVVVYATNQSPQTVKYNTGPASTVKYNNEHSSTEDSRPVTLVGTQSFAGTFNFNQTVKYEFDYADDGTLRRTLRPNDTMVQGGTILREEGVEELVEEDCDHDDNNGNSNEDEVKLVPGDDNDEHAESGDPKLQLLSPSGHGPAESPTDNPFEDGDELDLAAGDPMADEDLACLPDESKFLINPPDDIPDAPEVPDEPTLGVMTPRSRNMPAASASGMSAFDRIRNVFNGTLGNTGKFSNGSSGSRAQTLKWEREEDTLKENEPSYHNMNMEEADHPEEVQKHGTGTFKVWPPPSKAPPPRPADGSTLTRS